MKIDIDILKAFIEDCRWRNAVGGLFGPSWDEDGSQLIKLVWELIYDTWDEDGVEIINEYIRGRGPAYDPNGGVHYIRTVDYLFKMLNKFFLIETEKETIK